MGTYVHEENTGDTLLMSAKTYMQHITCTYGKPDSNDALPCGGNYHLPCKRLSVNKPDGVQTYISFKSR